MSKRGPPRSRCIGDHEIRISRSAGGGNPSEARGAVARTPVPVAWLGLLAGAALLLTSGCGTGPLDAAPKNASPASGGAAAGRGGGARSGSQAALIRAVPLRMAEIPPPVAVVGTVTPRHVSVVASGAEGLVEEFFVDHGQFVARGAELSRLRMETTDLEIEEHQAILEERQQALLELRNGSRSEEIAEAHAKWQATAAARRIARSKLDRAQQLFERNALNKDDLDDAQERLEAAEQAFDAAQAVYNLVQKGPREEQIAQAEARVAAQQAHVEFLLAEKEKRITRAPFDGFVVEVQTFVGMWLSKGDPVVTLAMLDEVEVVGNVDQSDLRHVQLGREAAVRVPGLADEHHTGRIVAIVPRSDWTAGSWSFPVKVRIKNRFYEEGGQKLPMLKAGMMAEVTFHGQPVAALLAPKDAVVRTSRGAFVYVFDPSVGNPRAGTVRQVTITTGLSEGTWIQVTADGLTAGMPVVTEGAERLRPFQDVELAPEGLPAE